jgi:hypothetical protein
MSCLYVESSEGSCNVCYVLQMDCNLLYACTEPVKIDELLGNYLLGECYYHVTCMVLFVL